jgi:pyruvate dehydrogenase E1 component alpha subunit/2-oxoisovalerate dehydrogenase E1 component alpha subunit
MGDVVSESVEVWKDEDEARARGLWQVLDEQGVARGVVPAIDDELLRGIFRSMLRQRLVDTAMLVLVEQGRLSAYADACGQEASVIASAAALAPGDVIVPSYREAGAALHRGLPLRAFVAQLLGNGHDIAKGRQMPGHAASPRSLAYLPTSSLASTQLPHATGIAWAAKLQKKPTVVLAYLGEGATSADDFHAGVNFAAAFKVPVVFLCQNNGWTGATPAGLQTRAETFALKALAYGMPGVRVDGNDALAVYAATSEAVARARSGGGPTLIEAVTLRLGRPGMSSGDSAATRQAVSEEERQAWSKQEPLARLGRYMTSRALLDEKTTQTLEAEIGAEIAAALEAEGNVPPPARETLFDDVYAALPANLVEQRDELLRIRRDRG